MRSPGTRLPNHGRFFTDAIGNRPIAAGVLTDGHVEALANANRMFHLINEEDEVHYDGEGTRRDFLGTMDLRTP